MSHTNLDRQTPIFEILCIFKNKTNQINEKIYLILEKYNIKHFYGDFEYKLLDDSNIKAILLEESYLINHPSILTELKKRKPGIYIILIYDPNNKNLDKLLQLDVSGYRSTDYDPCKIHEVIDKFKQITLDKITRISIKKEKIKSIINKQLNLERKKRTSIVFTGQSMPFRAGILFVKTKRRLRDRTGIRKSAFFFGQNRL